MKALLKSLIISLTTISMLAFADGDMKVLKVWAGDFTDRALATEVEAGDSCARWLQYLRSAQENYNLVSASGVQGPPGVVYTLINNRKEVAILKCGSAGSHEEGGHP